MLNEKVIGWAVVAILAWLVWLAYLVIRKLKGEAFSMTRGDLYEYLKK